MIKNFIEKLSVKKLVDDLEYWIFIGISSDLVELKNQRLEYLPIVNQALKLGYAENDIPKYVLIRLKNEMKLPFYKRPTFWHLVKLLFKKR